MVTRDSLVRVMRGGESVFEGKLHSLKRFEEDVKEVATGYECGIAIEGYDDLKEGDILEFYKREQVTL